MSRSDAPDSGWLTSYREWVKGWSRNNSRPQDAEDAAQEVAANMLSGDAPETLDNPKAYLQSGARNRLISEVQRQARHPTISLEELGDDQHPVLHDPEAPIRAQQLARALEKALAELPLRKRQAYIYHRLEGYTHPEIAQKMGVALNTVERYIMDANRHVRNALKDFCPD